MVDLSPLQHFVNDCHKNLTTSSDGEVVKSRSYLIQRKISDESISTHVIGYCNEETDIPDEIKYFGNKEVSYEGDKGYSSFIKGKLIVPIYDEFDQLVAFATRKPSFKEGNTWWNLPFPKGNHLFLLNKTRKEIFNQNKIYIVEGYIDALLLYQEGLKNICGIMGTHLSPRQIGLLLRYCNNVCACLDIDENRSGQKGSDKIIAMLKDFGFYEDLWVIDTFMGVNNDKTMLELIDEMKEL